MDVDCSGCGRCCFSPYNEAVVNLIRDRGTRRMLLRMIPRFIAQGIMRPDRVVRSGEMLLRDELEKLFEAGLAEAVVPHSALLPEDAPMAVIFRLRHLMMPLPQGNINVPVFACIFFDPKTRKCEIYGREFRPLQCRVYPFNILLEGRGLPICEPWRLSGTLTVEQAKLAGEYLGILKQFARRRFSGPREFMESLLRDRFPAAVEISVEDAWSLGLLPNPDEWMVDDLREDLGEINHRILSKAFRGKAAGEGSNGLVEHIKGKIRLYVEWWRGLTLTEKDCRSIYEAMKAIFWERHSLHGRLLPP